MTEARKEELRQLLEKALDNVVIRKLFEEDTLSKEQYIKILHHRCFFHGIYVEPSNTLNYLQYQADITDDKIKSRILEFISEELNQFLEDDKIGYSIYNVDGYADDGFRLVKRSITQPHNLSDIADVLRYLLKVSLSFGVEKAVLAFDQESCPDGNYRNYQSITSLAGITIETEIQICKGIRLVPIPREIAFQLNHNIRRYHRRAREKGTTLLIIERLLHSVFHKPSETAYNNGQKIELPFQVEENELELSKQGRIMDFRETFCQALSLACNTMVMFDYFWDYSAADVFRSDDVEQKIWYLGPIGHKAEVGQTEVEEAKQMYKILENLDQRTQKIFWIASERWRKSKTHQVTQDTLIDLAIAFEALYLF